MTLSTKGAATFPGRLLFGLPGDDGDVEAFMLGGPRSEDDQDEDDNADGADDDDRGDEDADEEEDDEDEDGELPADADEGASDAGSADEDDTMRTEPATTKGSRMNGAATTKTAKPARPAAPPARRHLAPIVERVVTAMRENKAPCAAPTSRRPSGRRSKARRLRCAFSGTVEAFTHRRRPE